MIEEMNSLHLDEVMQIEKACFSSGTWSKEAYIYEMEENPYSKFYVYKIDDRVVGVCGTYILFEQAQIVTIGVDPKYQGQGIAKEMLDYMSRIWEDEHCEFCTLEVRVSNDRAISLYKKYGFIQLSIRKEYYDSGEDAYVMGKAIGGKNENFSN